MGYCGVILNVNHILAHSNVDLTSSQPVLERLS